MKIRVQQLHRTDVGKKDVLELTARKQQGRLRDFPMLVQVNLACADHGSLNTVGSCREAHLRALQLVEQHADVGSGSELEGKPSQQPLA